MRYLDWVHRVNLAVARSPVGWWFRLENSGHVGLLAEHATRW